MNDTVTAVQGLTADDLAAARIAENVTFHTNTRGSFVRLYVRGAGSPAIFTAREQRLYTITDIRDRARELPASATAFAYSDRDYSRGWSWSTEGGWTHAPSPTTPPGCFHSMYDHDAWRTIARSLHLGDTLRLEWGADNNTEIAKDAGLHLDELRLIAIPADDRKPRNTWRIGSETCRDNTARMIRRYGN